MNVKRDLMLLLSKMGYKESAKSDAKVADLWRTVQVITAYTMFDLEATKRENELLKRMLSGSE